nr:hypothetical protein [Tanacetum cinerariifolium]
MGKNVEDELVAAGRWLPVEEEKLATCYVAVSKDNNVGRSQKHETFWTMATTIEQQVALDEALVPSTQRLRIGRSNFRFPSDIQSKESTFQLVYDVLRRCPFFKAFLSNDVTRLQALVDKKKVVVTEAAIRDALHLDDAEGVDCLPNKEIFTELARMGYEKPSTKLTFYKAFFSSQWKVKKLERTNKVKALKLRRLRKVGTSQRVDTSDDTIIEDVSNQGRIIDELDKDDGAADIYQINMDHAAKVLSMQEDESEVQEAVEKEPKPMKKKQQVELDEAYARKIQEELNQDINWEVAIDHVKQKAKEDPFIKRYQVMKKRPQTEAQARRNMMMYLKNTTGFRLDYFKGMSYDDIRLIFESKFNANMEFLLKYKEQIEEEANRAIESINETPAQKATKRRSRNEEVKDVEEIKQHLEIVPDEDDDVYTKATPLARKVPVVDYQIVHFNNKPHFKIIRADGTHQLYVSFITLLKNFDREDL